jgi:hypothetical protein
MTKWNEPKGPPPSWLNKADEVTAKEPPRLPINQFIVHCMEACLRLGLNVSQAANVTSNTRTESGNGQSYRCFNLYGWTLTKEHAYWYQKTYGKGVPYWCAPGNKAPGATLEDYKGGDAPWVYYRVFDSFESSLKEWIRHYVPKPEEHAPYGKYRECGRLFWTGGDWFSELIRLEYKGKRTKTDPKVREASIAEHRSNVRSSTVRWAQSRLKLDPDGAWGNQSKEACRKFQQAHGLPVTGELDDATLMAIAAKTSPV